MAIRGQVAYKALEGFVAGSASDIAEYSRILRDPTRTADGRAALLEPIRDRLVAFHQRVITNVEGFADGARRDYVAAMPRALERAAAILKPQRASEIRSLAEGQSVEELARLVELVVTEKDAAASYGLRQALQTAGDDAIPLSEALDEATSAGREALLADLVATQYVLMQLRHVGPLNDFDSGGYREPLALLQAGRAAGIVPINDAGGTRMLDTNEVERLLGVAGVPLKVPGERAELSDRLVPSGPLAPTP